MADALPGELDTLARTFGVPIARLRVGDHYVPPIDAAAVACAGAMNNGPYMDARQGFNDFIAQIAMSAGFGSVVDPSGSARATLHNFLNAIDAANAAALARQQAAKQTASATGTGTGTQAAAQAASASAPVPVPAPLAPITTSSAEPSSAPALLPVASSSTGGGYSGGGGEAIPAPAGAAIAPAAAEKPFNIWPLVITFGAYFLG